MAKAKKKYERTGRERPPNLRQAGQGEQRACSGCAHFMSNSYCARHQWPVKAFHVCDTWAERVEERTPDQERRDHANEVVMGGARNITIKMEGGAGA